MSEQKGAPYWAQLSQHRWHFQHGPIDLILEVSGEPDVVRQALTDSWNRFQSILPELVGELSELRRPVDEQPSLHTPVALRMLRACAPFAGERFITSMAAVAGAVADELIQRFEHRGIDRAFINNGGDIALYLSPGERCRVGICANVDAFTATAPRHPRALDSAFEIDAKLLVRGIATSGWRGRSFSLGIADSVTVIAADAAAADAAATLIANAVNCECEAIIRRPANELKDDTDLGKRLVTVRVPPLSPEHIADALERGALEGAYWRGRGLIYAAALFLQGRTAVVAPHGIQKRGGAALSFEEVPA